MKYYQHYLRGIKFTVYTDCNSLKASQQKIDDKVYRWWFYLPSFEFDIVYRKGKRMAHVDFFSRNPITKKLQFAVKAPEMRVDLTELSDTWLIAEQQRDLEITSLTSKLQNNELNESLASTYELRAGLLYRKI